MPFYVSALIIASHALIAIAGLLLIVEVCAELHDREVAKRATELARAMERHPAGKGLDR